jgi:general secretion pathway protein G
MPCRLPARGFTFVELLITVAMLALLATVAMPMAEVSVQRYREEQLRDALRQIREAIDAYKKAADEGHIKKTVDESGYPKQLDDLADGVEDIMDPKKKKLYFLRRVPADPMFEGTVPQASRTWGKRSYQSPPDEPREGADVFDVYSLSTRKGLNGIPYRQW